MTREIVDTGTGPNQSDGENQHDAWNKVNRMTDELYEGMTSTVDMPLVTTNLRHFNHGRVKVELGFDPSLPDTAGGRLHIESEALDDGRKSELDIDLPLTSGVDILDSSDTDDQPRVIHFAGATEIQLMAGRSDAVAWKATLTLVRYFKPPIDSRINALESGGVVGPAGPAGADSVVPGPQGIQGDTGADSVVPGPKGDKGDDSTVPGPQGPQGEAATTGLIQQIVAREHLSGPFPTDIPEGDYMFDGFSVYRANEFAGSFGTIDTAEFINGMRLEVNDKSYYWDTTQFVEIVGGGGPTTPIGKMAVEVGNWGGDIDVVYSASGVTFDNFFGDFSGAEWLEISINNGGYGNAVTHTVRMADLMAAVGDFNRGSVPYGHTGDHQLQFGLNSSDLSNMRLAGRLSLAGNIRIRQIRGIKYTDQLGLKGVAGVNGIDGVDGLPGTDGAPGEDLSGNTARVDTVELRADNLETNDTAILNSLSTIGQRTTALESSTQLFEGTTANAQSTNIAVTVPTGKKMASYVGMIKEPDPGPWINLEPNGGFLFDWDETNSELVVVANNAAFQNRPYRLLAYFG